MHDKAKSGAQGGAWDEAGGQYRRSLAALFVAHALNGLEFEGLPVGGAAAEVEAVGLETDHPIDDIFVGLAGARLFLQAKRTVAFGRPLDEVAAQWLKAVRDEDFDPTRDFVAAAGGALSKPVCRLARAIERLRLGPAGLTRGESEAVAKFREVLTKQGATDKEIELILARAVVLALDVEEASGEHAERGRLLLDGHVVAKGQGGRAFSELVAIAGRAARLRVGHGASGWLDELRKRGLPLTTDAEASRAAEIERRQRALEGYREKLRRRGESVDLSAVGARVRPIPLAKMDARISVHDPADSERDSHSLLWALRRRGRVLLTGLPGGGKSVAMAATRSAWASREGWAVPFAVSLRRLAERERFRKRPLRDEILELAVEVVEPSERTLVRDALDEALKSGEAVLFLDGLDEAADRSLELAADIANFLTEIHPDTDVLLATRDAAYADAEILGFRDLTLLAPQDPMRAVQAVLAALAEQRRLDEPDNWVRRRVDWVEETLALDRQLRETPLLPVLLALLAADDDTDNLPRTRALILADVVEDVVRRHEIKRDVTLAALGGHEAEALIGAFPVIATALESNGGSAARETLVEALLPYFCEQWGLRPAPARQTAREILRFWDESGIFVARGREAITAPRLQLFLEIGAALDAATRPAEAEHFVADSAEREDRREMLILAAGLSHPIADALIERACRAENERLALAAGLAIGQGGIASEESIRDLVRVLVGQLAPGDDEAWRSFTVLARLPVPADLQEDVLDALRDAFDPERATIGAGLAALDWGWEAEERDRALEACLRLGELRRLPRRTPQKSRNATVAVFTVDQSFMRVKHRAAEILLPGRPELAPLVVEAMAHASIGTVDDLAEVLRRNGHGKLANAKLKQLFSSEAIRRMARSFGDLDADVDRRLETIAVLAEPAELTRSQARRRDELASFLAALNMNEDSAWAKGSALDQLREPWYRLIAALGGFDLAVLAAQARLVKAELAEDTNEHGPFFSLFDAAQSPELARWDLVSGVAAGRKLALALLAGPRAVAVVAARALATHPERAETAAAIEALIHELPRVDKLPAMWALLNLADTDETAARYATDDDEALREAVASLIELTEGGRPTALGSELATDNERVVQLAAIGRFTEELSRASEPATPQLVALLERVAARAPQPFRCHRCGTANAAERDSCQSCSVVTAKPAEEAEDLLRTLRDGEPRGLDGRLE